MDAKQENQNPNMYERNQAEAIVSVTASPMEVAMIESQIATAKRYPRDIRVFKDKLMAMANLDQATAEGCYYALPRAGKTISGPSIRLAEIALSCYGNCVAEADIVGEDSSFIYAMGQCRDLENNVAIRIKVRRRITDKNGKRYSDDMIVTTANAACAIALRNAIFKVVPGAYIKPVFDKVKQTAVGKAASLSDRRAVVLARLALLGVDEARVLSLMKRKSVDEITFDDVANLIGLGTAVYDGDIQLDEAFPSPVQKEDEKTKTGTDGLKDRLKNGDKKTTPAEEPDPEFDAKRKEQIEAAKAADKADEVSEDKTTDTTETKPEKKTDAEPEEQTVLRYLCQGCSHEFSRRNKNQGCPKCMGQDLIDRRIR